MDKPTDDRLGRTQSHPGLQELFSYPLMDAIVDRRTRRVARGTSVAAGPLSHDSKNAPVPLTKLEEAVLIVATGLTGSSTMHDVTTKNAAGEPSFSAPLLNILSRGTSSIDNSHSVSFFLINDEGTFLLRQRRNREALAALAERPERWEDWSESDWIAAAESVKHKLYAERVDFPREWPYYFIWNRQLSNRPGTTMLLPIVDVSRQLINVYLSLLSEDEGQRPIFIDDWSRFKPKSLLDWAGLIGGKLGITPEIPYHLIGGVKRVQSGLRADAPVPIGYYRSLRTEYETFLMLQNLMLISQGMGLGAWLHAAPDVPFLFERDPKAGKFGIEFRMKKARPRSKWPPLPTTQPNPVGIDGVLEALTPPYVKNMDAAVDQLIEEKYGPEGTYGDLSIFERSYRDKNDGAEFLKQAAKRPSAEAIEYTKEICNYIYDTYGRFPAHCDAFLLPGVWLQFSHLELEYYDKMFDERLYARQASHERFWTGK